MAGNIKGMTVEIGGNTAPLEQALKDANREINTTQKELKEVNKLLKLDPTNTQLLAQKQQLLKQQVEQTTTKLDALRQAQKQLDDEMKKGGTVNQEEYRKLQREIIATEKSLKGLKEEQKQVNPQMQKFKEQITQWKGELQKASQVANVFAQGLKAMAVASVGAITSLGTLALKAGQTADELNTLSKTTGLSTKELQEFQYASDLIDVDLNTLSGALKKTTTAMSNAKGGTGKSADAFKKLGVSIKNADGTLRDNNDVFKDSIRALGNIANETERDALAMELFGKSATELNPLIKGGIDDLDKMSKKANELGLILSQDALDGANAFNDEIDILKANTKGIFNKIGAEIAKDLTPAMQKLNEATEKTIKRLSTALDEGGLAGLMNELIAIFNEIDWSEIASLFSDGLNNIIDAWNNFFAEVDWQQLGANIIEFIKNIDWASLISDVFSIIGNIIGAGIGILTGAFTTLKDDISNWWNEKMTEAGGDSGQAFLNGAKETIIKSGSTLYDSMAQPLAQGLADALNIDVDIPNFHKLTQNIGIWWEDLRYKWQNNILLPIQTALLTMDDKIYRFFDGIAYKWNQFTNFLDNIGLAIATWREQKIYDIKNFVESLLYNIIEFFTNLGENIQIFFTQTLPEKWNDLMEWLKGLPAKLGTIGQDLVEGLFEGMKNATGWLKDKLHEWADSIVASLKSFLGIESPSKVMANEVGTFMAEGIGVGFNKTMPAVIDAMKEKLATITDAFQTELAFGDIPQIEGNKIISENQYITRNYSNTVETIRQPQTVELVLDGTKLARTMIQPLNNEYNRLGVNL